MGRSRIAGHDYRLDPIPAHESHDFPRIADNGFRRFISIGNTRGITEIEDVFRRKQLTHRMDDCQPTYPGIKGSDGLILAGIAHGWVSAGGVGEPLALVAEVEFLPAAVGGVVGTVG